MIINSFFFNWIRVTFKFPSGLYKDFPNRLYWVHCSKCSSPWRHSGDTIGQNPVMAGDVDDVGEVGICW